MSNVPNLYETASNVTENGALFFFVSKGNSDIIKAVQYSHVLDFEGRMVFNLGFGDYDPVADSILDEVISNNGDAYKVFNTVLSTIPYFFTVFKDAMMMVSGSDSRQEYQDICRQTCRKKCSSDQCKNAHRRINLYRSYVNKNFLELSKHYKFYAGTVENENQIFIEDYSNNTHFNYVFLTKF